MKQKQDFFFSKVRYSNRRKLKHALHLPSYFLIIIIFFAYPELLNCRLLSTNPESPVSQSYLKVSTCFTETSNHWKGRKSLQMNLYISCAGK